MLVSISLQAGLPLQSGQFYLSIVKKVKTNLPCYTALMIIALLYYLLALSLSPYAALPAHSHLASGQDYSTMSTLNIEVMKQLLADQSRTILSEIKNHVQAEVSAQLGPHAARVDQLYDDQVLIKKQLNNILLVPQHQLVITTSSVQSHLSLPMGSSTSPNHPSVNQTRRPSQLPG